MFEVVSVIELGLGADTKLPIDRLHWTTDGEKKLRPLHVVRLTPPHMHITVIY